MGASADRLRAEGSAGPPVAGVVVLLQQGVFVPLGRALLEGLAVDLRTTAAGLTGTGRRLLLVPALLVTTSTTPLRAFRARWRTASGQTPRLAVLLCTGGRAPRPSWSCPGRASTRDVRHSDLPRVRRLRP
jgi:hypothetical protein